MAKTTFEWDPRKSEINISKHGVSFFEAQRAFLARISHKHCNEFGQPVLSDGSENSEGKVSKPCRGVFLGPDGGTDVQIHPVLCEKCGLGEFLLMDALTRCLRVSEEIAVFAVIVDAKNQQAKDFYLKYGFIPLEDQELSLFLPIDTIKRT